MIDIKPDISSNEWDISLSIVYSDTKYVLYKKLAPFPL